MEMVGNHNSSDNRLKAIEYYLNNDISQEEISKVFKISRRTFIRLLKEYEDDKIERKPKKSESYKVKEKHVKKTLRKIPKPSFINFMKYAYQLKEPRKYVEKKSTRRKKYKIYKK